MPRDFTWQLKQPDTQIVQHLSQELGASTTLAKILVNRKITTKEQAGQFLNTHVSHVHDPYLLQDMDRAVERLYRAIQNQEKICVYGDYDVDGAVSTSLLIHFFRDLNIPLDYYIPHRLFEGYSLNANALKTLAGRGIKLIITVDNGIMAHAEVGMAQKMGMDVIVTDHHQVGDALPEAVAVVNPQRKDCAYPFKGICGAGVAFKLIIALRKKLRDAGFFKNREEPNLKNALDLLSIATVCDMVPLKDENRYFVKEGLKLLPHTQKPGLRALMEVCALKNKVTPSDLGFRIGPRINACGRLEDAALGVNLLTAEHFEQGLSSAKILNDLNIERRSIELGIVKDAIQKIASEIDLTNTLGLVLFQADWHMGVVGIVASRVVEEFGRPVFVLTEAEEGIVKGSGRSVSQVNLIQALRDSSQYLIKFGGHEAAAGVTLKKSNLQDFTHAFDDAVKKQMSFSDLARVISADDTLSMQDINKKLLDELEQLEPHGMGNPRPVFVSANLQVVSKRVVGRDHLKLTLGDGHHHVDAIAFGKASAMDGLGDQVGVLYQVEYNIFNDIKRIQMIVKEFV